MQSREFLRESLHFGIISKSFFCYEISWRICAILPNWGKTCKTDAKMKFATLLFGNILNQMDFRKK